MKKLFSIVLCLVCLFSFLSVGAAETAQDEFLSELSGRTYVELFPEFAKDEYHQAWLDVVTPIVGEDAAENVVAYLLNVCMGSLYGEEAIAAYEADPDSMQFNCYYLGGVKKITVDGSTIYGVDVEVNSLYGDKVRVCVPVRADGSRERKRLHLLSERGRGVRPVHLLRLLSGHHGHHVASGIPLRRERRRPAELV